MNFVAPALCHAGSCALGYPVVRVAIGSERDAPRTAWSRMHQLRLRLRLADEQEAQAVEADQHGAALVADDA